ncbi:MAG TPA: cyclodeaminase/cyclohydrolase family protein [Candidatus Limnocylindrales bacterium]|nr:cyclodeaminase/cyclohydrolase family protein [Candidatus Limnocylindrales bacterium]
MSGPVRHTPIGEYVQALASTAAVPGGGSAAAVAAAMGCGLIGMVARLSARRAKDPASAATLEQLVPEAEALADRLMTLSQDDVDAYRAVVTARREGAAAEALAAANLRAAEVPLETARAAAAAIALHRRLQPLAWSMTASDADAAGLLLGAGFRAALANVAVNLPELKGEARDRIQRALVELQRTNS